MLFLPQNIPTNFTYPNLGLSIQNLSYDSEKKPEAISFITNPDWRTKQGLLKSIAMLVTVATPMTSYIKAD